MKKLLSFSIATFAIGLALGYFLFKGALANPVDPLADYDISHFEMAKCKGTIVDEASEICVDSAYQMVQTYRGRLFEKEPTRTIWFSYKRIEKLYNKLKADRDSGMATDGLRIYFGTYPKEYKSGKKHPHAKKNTIIFVSTKDSLNGKFHRDYYNNVMRLVPENKGELCPPGDCPSMGALLLKPVE